jgi:DNA-binding MarR family transcriptional regulator
VLVGAHAHILAHIQPSRNTPVSDPDALQTILEFTEFVAAAANSSRQKERVVRAAGVPITGAGLTALRAIERYGPLAVSELARRVRVDLSTMSRQLRPLETLGLVARSTDPADGRVAWLTVSAKGRNLLARVDQSVVDDFDAALADLSPSDRADLARLLERFQTGLVANRAAETRSGTRPD